VICTPGSLCVSAFYWVNFELQPKWRWSTARYMKVDFKKHPFCYILEPCPEYLYPARKKSALLQQPLTALLVKWQLLHKVGVFCVCVICVFVCVPTSSLYKAADAACFWSCCLCLCALSHGRVADPKLESTSSGLSAKPSRRRAFVPASAIQLHSSQTHVRRHFQSKEKYFPSKIPNFPDT
jgi:hypothetical protein